MVTTVLVIILAALILSMILDAWPSANLSRALVIVLFVVLLLWLLGGVGAQRAW